MTVQDRAEEIAHAVVKASLRQRLRNAFGETDDTAKAACVAKLEALYAQGLTPAEAYAHAAQLTYRAIAAEEDAKTRNNQISRMLDDLEIAEAASTGTPQEMQAALTELGANRRTFVSMAVELGQSVYAKQKASAGGKKRQEKSAVVKAFAIEQYEQRSWKSMRQARNALWPVVQTKAQEIGWVMSTTQGPETLYDWLRAHKKSTRSAS